MKRRQCLRGKKRNSWWMHSPDSSTKSFTRHSPTVRDVVLEVGDPVGDTFLEAMESLPRPRDNIFQAGRLFEIIQDARTAGKTATHERLALYLKDIFPPPRDCRIRNRRADHHGTLASNRQKRRSEYARTQTLWRRNRKGCVQHILDNMDHSVQPEREVMEPFWKSLMTTPGNNTPGSRPALVVNGIWAPISHTDLKFSRIPRNSAAGPDGVSARLYRSLPPDVLLGIFNTIMWCGKLPEILQLSRTVFLPKKSGASDPGDFRPITIPSVLLRGLHRILARRMEVMLPIDERQRAFRSVDGCADNTFLLDLILRQHRKQFRSVYVASLDVGKAFDSVSHQAIRDALESMGIPPPMLEYLQNVYSGSRTRLEGSTWKSTPFHPERGVRQGDPLSPIIFNVVTHHLLRSLPEDIGVRTGNTTINAAAFADDLLLFSSTPAGLQELIDVTVKYLDQCGMSINAAKCLTIAIKAIPHLKKTAVDPATKFQCGGRVLPSLSRSGCWRYLGVTYTPEGRQKYRPADAVSPLLESLSKAPMKPQQRLFSLRTFVLPRLYHQLALGAVTIGALNKTDKIIRSYLRKWLALPHDVPVAYFHAAIRDGGLGVPSVRWTAPLLRRGRLIAAMRTHEHQGPSEFLQRELESCTRRLTDHGRTLGSPEELLQRWADRLHNSVDGAGLKDSRRTPHQHQWIGDGSMMLSGRDYVNCGRMRISAIPTRSRTTRGRHQDRRCRAGCQGPETLNHVLQHCHRTHAARVKRHNAIITYIQRRVRRNGYEQLIEPHYRTTDGLRKPDLVAILGQTAIVVDAQVVSEQTDLNVAHHRKKAYYSQQAFTQHLKERHRVENVLTTTATLSWRGVWSPGSAKELLDLGFVSKADLKIITTRVLIGNLAAFRTFNAVTSVVPRAGIG